ncbi:MAG: chitobiase/beta-hexosaminidase C-terminal domain-containing protein, partial [Muribaculaceae bacterium]|nr:chitobiase/beta-hexosaminidase C-terminal domain-containing protein [Muribaculaceae bacterium]
LGLAERGWNSKKTYSNAEFNRVIEEHELPTLHKEGVAFHLRAPGIKEIDGKLHMNSPYKGAVIRYTLDGTNPTDKSPVYTAPIAPGNAKQVRAKMEYLGKNSTVSVLNR